MEFSGEFGIIRAGYPFCFERKSGEKKIFVAINPSKYSYTCDIPEIDEVYVSQNITVDSGTLQMDGISYIVACVK